MTFAHTVVAGSRRHHGVDKSGSLPHFRRSSGLAFSASPGLQPRQWRISVCRPAGLRCGCLGGSWRKACAIARIVPRGSAAIGPAPLGQEETLVWPMAATVSATPRLYLTEPLPTGIANGRYGAWAVIAVDGSERPQWGRWRSFDDVVGAGEQQ
jgi:hypothetical protein